MNSMDGVKNAPKGPAGLGAGIVPSAEAKKLPKSAEEYVAIENRLAAQRNKPTENPQITSIFDQLRTRIGK